MVAQQTKESEASPFKIEVKVNKVFVPVVVRDAQRHAVGTLRKENFQVFDKDKPQIISGFAVQKRGMENVQVEGGTLSSATPTTTLGSTALPRFTVFFFDDLHLGAEDLGQVQKLGMKMLSAAVTGSDMAAIVSVSGMNSGLIRDPVKLEEAILKLKSRSLYSRTERQCPNIDYYEADLIQNKREDTALEAAVQQTLACASLDPKTMRNVAEIMVRSAAANALVTGDQDSRVTLAALRDFVRKMGTLPGQRTLILISAGFLTSTPEAMRWKTQILDLAAQSNVTISALDARGLYTTELDASERGPDSAMAMQTGYESQSHRASMALNENVMAELADGSGGAYFHNSNNLEAGFKELAAVPEYLYILELSLDNVEPDGTYHPLKVKVDKNGLQLQARRGYFASKPEQNNPAKDKLRQAGKDRQDISGSTLLGGHSSHADSRGGEIKRPDNKLSDRSMNWTPPLVDAPIRPDASSPPCLLSNVLEQAGARAGELYDNLQSFSAQERIEYQASDHMGYLQDARTGTFEYVVTFQQTPGGTTIQESRQPKHGSRLLTAFTQDIGLAEMALMFLPEMQGDYEMTCEGNAEWNGKPAWVIHFVQRKDRPGHTLSFRDSKGTDYPARLKGRAWIAADSGKVIHLESSLTEEIPKAKVRHWYLSINYAPVQFHSRDLQMVLPQTVDAYCDFDSHRTIAYHTFTDFTLFSVKTTQTTEKQ